jgi:tRNA threonylcarbamoyladenosine biosynthesis protein TsaB
MAHILAIECSTDTLSLALQAGSAVLTHTSAGGAQTSHSLLPQIRALMREAGLKFEQLDAIAFGRGPGSFTGLRSACAVAQGLGFAANVKLLPVDTLAILAHQARLQPEHAQASQVLAVLDARMNEVYVGSYVFNSGMRNVYAGMSPVSPLSLGPEALGSANVWVTNAFEAYETQWCPALRGLPRIHATPSAAALLQLAPTLMAAGHLVDAAQALPLYSRDKVALTTQEREAAKAHPAAPSAAPTAA